MVYSQPVLGGALPPGAGAFACVCAHVHVCACVHACVCVCIRVCVCVRACTASPGLQAVEIIFLEEGKGCYPRKDGHVAAAVPGCPEPSRPFPAQGTSPNTLKQRANMSPTGPKSTHDFPASQAQEAPYGLTSPIPTCPRLAHVPQTRRPPHPYSLPRASLSPLLLLLAFPAFFPFYLPSSYLRQVFAKYLQRACTLL